ncbi:putative Polycomb group protein ASXL2 [Aplochiton taeniatus]
MRERQKKMKGRTWAEAAKTVLEKYPNTPMSHKEILQVIQRERLKEISGTSPLACLNAMLHTNSRGDEGIFYKVPGRMGVYTLKKDISGVVKDLSEEGTDDSSDNLSDSPSTENNNNANTQETRRARWRRNVPSKLQSQPSSPQPRCSSPSVPTKIISPSQKHSKKALKQALKQQQQRNQRRRGGVPATSSPRILLKAVKDMADAIATKPDLSPAVNVRKLSQRSSRLSARQLRRTKCEIDVETPDSILVNTNLRALFNKHTFSLLPAECQQRLFKLLPEVDQQASIDGALKLTNSALNNEFFTSAAQSWKERLSDGEFTPELQLRIRQEIEKEKKVELWKEAFFENYYGENSGLSYGESKGLTEANMNQESAKPQSPLPQTGTVALAPEDPKVTKDSRQKDAKDRKATPSSSSSSLSLSAEELTKIDSVMPRETAPSTGHMKTRRSLYVENKRLLSKTLSAPTPVVTAPLERRNERALSESTLPGKEPKKEVQEEGVTASQATSPPPSQFPASSQIKENPPSNVNKPKQESEDAGPVTRVSVAPEPGLLKRKSSSELEDVGELTPEKRPRVSSVSSVSPVSPPAPSVGITSTTTTVGPRVPPLKIPVSRIVPVPPVSPSPVSPRTPLPVSAPLSSPGRTGARTLADIKAKAHRARAERAAAAAAISSSAKGAVPGPGPGGGGGALTQALSTPSLKLIQPSARLPQSSSSSLATTSSRPPSHISSNAQTELRRSQTPSVSRDRHADGNQTGDSASDLITGSKPSDPPENTSEGCAKDQETTVFGGFPSRAASFYIPANNPLVTQLLQGKEVPLEQILRKPLSKVEVKVVHSGSKGKTSHTPSGSVQESRPDQQMSAPPTLPGRVSVLPGEWQAQREMPDKDTQEQILQALMHKAHPNQPCKAGGPQPSQYSTVRQLDQAEPQRDSPRFLVGFLGRKSLARPAVTGHYLLNVSTYGRGSEGSKRSQQMTVTTPSLGNLKKEVMEGEEVAKEEESQGKLASPVAGVKMEPQVYWTSNCDEAWVFQQGSKVKSESLPVGCVEHSGAARVDNSATSSGAKETNPFSQSNRRHLELYNSKQGYSEPYHITPHAGMDPSSLHPLAFQTQRTLGNQEAGLGAYYGGTISMSVPQAFNQSLAATVSSASGGSDGCAATGSVMSFSVTVTTIPAIQALDHSDQAEPSPVQSFMEGPNMEEVQSQCYCRLKAMIMCKGCGAFCHDDCIGPSKLCVSCLVVR